jgi:hypothetical protein
MVQLVLFHVFHLERWNATYTPSHDRLRRNKHFNQALQTCAKEGPLLKMY